MSSSSSFQLDMGAAAIPVSSLLDRLSPDEHTRYRAGGQPICSRA
jgi:hypothetical protein